MPKIGTNLTLTINEIVIPPVEIEGRQKTTSILISIDKEQIWTFRKIESKIKFNDDLKRIECTYY